MAVASIVCVDGELDVHDTAVAAVTAAIERRREIPGARIGIAASDLEVGDPLGFAKRLSELAEPGTILVSDPVRRATRDRAYVDLGAISTTGYLDRIHVFELDGATRRERTVLSLEVAPRHTLVTGTDAQADAEDRDVDRRVWATCARHGGLIQRSHAGDYLAAFAVTIDAARAALAIRRDLAEFGFPVYAGLERGSTSYRGDRWVGASWLTAERIRSRREDRLAATMTVVEAVGPAGLWAVGLVIEVVEEVVQRGVRDPVRVAQLRIT